MSEAVKFQPKGDRVLVDMHPEKDEQRTEGGILLANDPNAKDFFVRGTVLAKGPGRWVNGFRNEPNVSIGDVVLFLKKSAPPVVVEGKIYFLVAEIDIWGVEGTA